MKNISIKTAGWTLNLERNDYKPLDKALEEATIRLINELAACLFVVHRDSAKVEEILTLKVAKEAILKAKVYRETMNWKDFEQYALKRLEEEKSAKKDA